MTDPENSRPSLGRHAGRQRGLGSLLGRSDHLGLFRQDRRRRFLRKPM
ncbi:hypothetical protein ACRAWD_10160 [Caulobacter segnis]